MRCKYLQYTAGWWQETFSDYQNTETDTETDADYKRFFLLAGQLVAKYE